VTVTDSVIFAVLTLISVAFFGGFVFCFIRRIINAKKKKRLDYKKDNMIMFLLIVGAVWLFRFAVSLFAARYNAQLLENGSLNGAELFFVSFLHTLQTFSLDEDYTAFLQAGNGLVAAAPSLVIFLFRCYSTLLNITATVAGSAVIIQILTNIFPKIKIYFLLTVFKQKKYIFSELNERSLALALSIREHERQDPDSPSSVIIFTDVYVDDEEERSTELYLSAKRNGFLCSADDLSHFLSLECRGELHLMLMDEKESDNVRMLGELASERFAILANTERIYVFYQDDSLTLVRHKAFANMMKLAEEAGVEKASLPQINRINCYQSMVYDILQKHPLFDTVKADNSVSELRVAIVGAGIIGKEMFLGAYWCGQISDMELHLNVVSLESRDHFVNEIDSVNPEIMDTANPDSPLLRIRREENAMPDRPNMSAPYFNFGYCAQDLGLAAFEKVCFDNGDKLIDSDYVLVALGSDSVNIRYAEKLARAIRIANRCKNRANGTKILYIVYDSTLCRLLNDNADNSDGIELIAVGDLNTVYGYNNIIESRYLALAQQFSGAYQSLKKDASLANSDAPDALKKQYNYWSDIARSIHIPYRVYSAIRLANNPLAGKENEPTPQEIYEKGYFAALEHFFDIIDSETNTDSKPVSYGLRWLENRRWNAFLRTQSYRTIDKTVDANHKIKVHPCIAECENEMLYPRTDGVPVPPDMLDEVCEEKNTPYKIYDDPAEFDLINREKFTEFYRKYYHISE